MIHLIGVDEMRRTCFVSQFSAISGKFLVLKNGDLVFVEGTEQHHSMIEARYEFLTGQKNEVESGGYWRIVWEYDADDEAPMRPSLVLKGDSKIYGSFDRAVMRSKKDDIMEEFKWSKPLSRVMVLPEHFIQRN